MGYFLAFFVTSVYCTHRVRSFLPHQQALPNVSKKCGIVGHSNHTGIKGTATTNTNMPSFFSWPWHRLVGYKYLCSGIQNTPHKGRSRGQPIFSPVLAISRWTLAIWSNKMGEKEKKKKEWSPLRSDHQSSQGNCEYGRKCRRPLYRPLRGTLWIPKPRYR